MSNDQTPRRRYRLLRVLEYVGDAEFIHRAIERRTVKGRYLVGDCFIQEAIIGESGELLSGSKPDAVSVDIAAHVVADKIAISTQRLRDEDG